MGKYIYVGRNTLIVNIDSKEVINNYTEEDVRKSFKELFGTNKPLLHKKLVKTDMYNSAEYYTYELKLEGMDSCIYYETYYDLDNNNDEVGHYEILVLVNKILNEIYTESTLKLVY